MPARTRSSWRFDNLPTSSVSNSRSTVIIWEAIVTESFGNPVALAGRSALPGASAQVRLLVKGTQTTVRIRLRLRSSPWTTRTGRRKPGPEPVGSGRLAQYRWPWEITTRCFQAAVLPLPQSPDRDECRLRHKRDSSPRLQLQDHGVRRIRSRLPYTPGCAISSGDGIIAPRHDKLYPGSISLFSYPKYNRGDCPVQTDYGRAASAFNENS